MGISGCPPDIWEVKNENAPETTISIILYISGESAHDFIRCIHSILYYSTSDDKYGQGW
jgi:hypothetical protein